MKFKYLIDNIAINFCFSKNFANMEDKRKKCSQMMDMSKFTFNKKVLSGVVALHCNKVCF